jgi:hypothetical protein
VGPRFRKKHLRVGADLKDATAASDEFYLAVASCLQPIPHPEGLRFVVSHGAVFNLDHGFAPD